MPSKLFEKSAKELLGGLRETGTYKQLRYVTGQMGATVSLDGIGEVIVLCSNNYLGLANNPEVVAAGLEGIKKYGAGTASVRFICGTFDCHREIEKRIADFSNTEASLTYVSCWCANEALIATAVGKDDVILSDELNHASIIDGCRLSKPRERAVYKHGDMQDLEAKLRQYAGIGTTWVITDGVFSMEGAVADLKGIVSLCRKYNAMSVVDDSHGVGVLGGTGRGTAEHCGVMKDIDIITGTLGKALGGAAGGYVAGPQYVIDLLVQRSRPSLFSNALPPTVACSAGKAIEIVQRDSRLVSKLRSNIAQIRTGLKKLGFDCKDSPTGIIPIHIGDEADAIKKSNKLMEMGVWVVAFGFPVVPKGKARLRVQVSAALEQMHIDRVLEAFSKL